MAQEIIPNSGFVVSDIVNNSNDNFTELYSLTVGYSAGVSELPSYQDNGDGSVTIGSGKYILNNTTRDVGQYLQEYTIAGDTFTLVDGVANYIVANYNSGTPVVQHITDVNLIDESLIIPIFTIVRTGTVLHKIDWGMLGILLANKLHASIVKTDRYRRQSGLVLSEYGTRNLNLTSGIVWVGANDMQLTEINSDIDNISFYYHVAGVWTKSFVTQYNNTQYDDGTDLVSLPNNSYTVNFVYRGVEEDKHLYIVLGNSSYTLREAGSAQPPTIPTEISSHATLVGKVIVEKGINTAAFIQSAFEIPFNQSVATSHGDLSDIELANTGITYGHIDDQVQSIYGVKTFNNFPITPSSAPTTDYQVANKKYVDDNSGGSATTAYQEVAFNKSDPRIRFDSNKTIYGTVLVDQDIILQVDLTNAKDSFESFVLFKGNGTNTLTLDNFENVGTINYDGSTDVVNAMVFAKAGEKFVYNILSQYTEDTNPPVLQTAVVRKGTENIIELEYDEALDNTSVPATTDFTVEINTVAQTVTDVAINPQSVDVTIGTSVVPGDTVTITYVIGANPIRDLSSNNASALTDQPVTNQTQEILGLTNVEGYWIAESSADFSLTGSDINTWLDRSTNSRDMNASGTPRTFDSVNKAVVTAGTSGEYLNFATLLNLGTEHTIVFYEEYTYRDNTTTFGGEDGAVDYIGEGTSSRYQYSSDAGVDYFDKGTLPSGIKKHVIRRNGGNLKWEVNGTSKVHSTDVISGDPTAQFRWEGLGFSTFLNSGNTHAVVLFSREVTDDEVNNVILPEIDGILGI